MNSGERRITKSTAGMMVIVALLFDLIEILLNLVPFLGWILIWLMDMLVWLTFFLWFKVRGVGFSSKRSLSLGLGLLIEIIPVVDILPGWTLAVILMIRSSWKEDDLAAKTVEGPGEE